MDAFDEMLDRIKEYGYTEQEMQLLNELAEENPEDMIILLYRLLKMSQEVNASLVETCKMFQEADLVWRGVLVERNIASVVTPDRAYREDLLDD